MLAKLRRVLIAARFRASRPDQPTPGEIRAIHLAWENAGGITTKVELPGKYAEKCRTLSNYQHQPRTVERGLRTTRYPSRSSPDKAAAAVVLSRILELSGSSL